jgi:sugar lactone lactonase YvrE
LEFEACSFSDVWSLVFGVSTLLFSFCAPSQPFSALSTLAGYAGPGNADGSAATARFFNPAAVAMDAAGNLYVADTGNHTIRKFSSSGLVITLAGSPGMSGTNDGAGSSARFNQPQGLAVDAGGNVYVADTGNETIRKITLAGVVSTLSGLAGVGGSGDGPVSIARFSQPQGLAVDSATNIYVADYLNHTIRKITPAGIVSTFAGLAGNYGTSDGTGTNAQFYLPADVAADSSGNLYVADYGNNTIRKISPAGAVTTLAGLALTPGSADATGTNALFYQPQSIAVDSVGNVYVSDSFNNTVRQITPAGVVKTLAGLAGSFGSADGLNSAARFWQPAGLAVSGANGALYLADLGNSTIRKITVSAGNWITTTLAGSPSAASLDGTGSASRFSGPGGIAADSASNLYVADTANNTIRKITASGSVSTLAGSAGQPGSGDGSGINAQFFGPQGMAADPAGNLYVADTANHIIRKLTPAGSVSTLAGSPGNPGAADGPGGLAQFNQPQGVAADASSNVYVADTGNHTIRRIAPDGTVSTLAGSPGESGDADGPAAIARFNWPSGLAIDRLGNIYVADCVNHAVRQITPAGVVSTLAGLPGVWGNADGANSDARFFQPQGIALDPTGNLYVLDSGNHTLRLLQPSGGGWVVSTVAGLAGLSGSADGGGSVARLYFPAALAAGPNRLYVADTANNTIRLDSLITSSAPTIVLQPQSRTVNPGDNAPLNVSAVGAAPLSYQWQFNSTAIPGATASAYTRTNIQTADLGLYSVFVSNPQGNALSAGALISFGTAPFIGVQPQDQSVLPGQAAAFNVVAGGGQPLAYQWLFNGQVIPGATASSLSLPAVSAASGGLYSVQVTNSLGVALSSSALLQIILVEAWGDNTTAQLSVPNEAANVVAVAAGAWHNLALRANGTVLAWGDNSAGQCALPANLTNGLAIAAGGYHSLAIRANGSLLAWGDDSYGQTDLPSGLSHVLAISAGAWHSLALHTDGTLLAWGDDTSGQTDVPLGLTNLLAIAAGGDHSLALQADHTVVAWGDNSGADGTFAGQSIVPFGLSNVTAIAAGDYHSLALRADGTVVAWGDDSQGQCDVPAGLTNVAAVAGGGAHSLALRADGSVVAWGLDWSGQCDLLPTLTNAVAAVGGEDHTLVLLAGAFPPPKLLLPSRKGTSFSVLFQTFNRKNYSLESINSLTTTNWTAVSTVSGNGALRLLTDPTATATQRFYRLRQ